MVFVGAYISCAVTPDSGQLRQRPGDDGRHGLELAGAAGTHLGINPLSAIRWSGRGGLFSGEDGILGELTTGDKLVKATALRKPLRLRRFCSVPSRAAYWPTGMSSLRWLPARWPTRWRSGGEPVYPEARRRPPDNPGGCRR